MKRRLTLLDKLKIFRMFMKESKVFALIEACNCCKSSKIKRVSWSETGNTYHAKYECMKCHATADVMESWVLPKALDPTESPSAAEANKGK